ncbi:MAG TPA: MCP four helix bundle domain-containing protein [Parafilimonas sp.]|nr:MCP four helix bundle domain-containing protein [Parafilimonas sp.]
MKWAYRIKDKMKAVAVLLLIIVLILVNNISNRKTFSRLNESIASIYKDRLMPATYIFQLTDHLYQKKFLNNEQEFGSQLGVNAHVHDTAIANLIKTYETTYLTASEKEQWKLFKQHLENYNTLAATSVQNKKAINDAFEKVVQNLNALSEIQAKEGSQIFKISSLNINGTIIMSQLEIALLLILGIFALVLVSANDNRLLQMQNSRMN